MSVDQELRLKVSAHPETLTEEEAEEFWNALLEESTAADLLCSIRQEIMLLRQENQLLLEEIALLKETK